MLLAAKDQHGNLCSFDTEDLGNLFVTEFVVVREDQRHPVLFRKRSQSLADVTSPFGRKNFRKRTRPTGRLLIPLTGVGIENSSFSSLPPQQVDAVVAGDLQDPRGQRKRRVV